jgi:hypothetical protein
MICVVSVQHRLHLVYLFTNRIWLDCHFLTSIALTCCFIKSESLKVSGQKFSVGKHVQQAIDLGKSKLKFVLSIKLRKQSVPLMIFRLIEKRQLNLCHQLGVKVYLVKIFVANQQL